MRKKSFLARALAACLCCASLVFTGGCAHDVLHNVSSAQRKSGFYIAPGRRVAVLTFAGPKGSVLSELISIELLRQGIDVVERDSLDRIITEVKRTKGGLYDHALSEQEIIRRLGKVVNVDYIVYGDSGAIDPDTIRLYDAKKSGGYMAGMALVVLAAVFIPGGAAALAVGAPAAVGPSLLSVGIVGAAGGGVLMGVKNPYKDYGDTSPKYDLATNSLSLRVFSTRSGEVLWWGSFDTYAHAGKGNHVKLMDHLRVSAKIAAVAMTHPGFKTFQVREKDSGITTIALPQPYQGAGAPAPTAAQPAPATQPPATAPTPAPTTPAETPPALPEKQPPPSADQPAKPGTPKAPASDPFGGGGL